MRKQIRAWKEEHRNFEKLLTVMEDEFHLFRTGRQPNYPLLLDVVSYMTQYPVGFHDRTEDLAFETVLERLPSAARLVESFHWQHALVVRSGSELRRLRGSLRTSVPRLRADIERSAQTYIDAFRMQLGMEERVILPLAQGLLSAEDWAELQARFQAGGDAFFRTTLLWHCRALHQQIAREVGCECVTH